MPDTPEKFSEEEMRPGDVRNRWRSVKRLMEFCNAFFDFHIITTSGKNLLTIAQGNVTLELDLPVKAATAIYPIPPLTVVAANDDAHPGRVRVYKGRLGGLLPSEMHLVDKLLPDGTDNRCYLTMPEGIGYVYGKILVDTGAGRYTGANVYQVGSQVEPDGAYLYLLVATVVTTDGAPVVSQEWTGGNWNPAAAASADGSLLNPVGA